MCLAKLNIYTEQIAGSTMVYYRNAAVLHFPRHRHYSLCHSIGVCIVCEMEVRRVGEKSSDAENRELTDHNVRSILWLQSVDARMNMSFCATAYSAGSSPGSLPSKIPI